jgi:ribosome-associated toxin RatA of RatAB toxin-antitoxin module
MFAKILIVVGALIVLLVVIAALQPSDFRVTRSASIAAPASVVFSKVNDLRAYQQWNPWAKFDPAAKYSHSGAPAGVGASLAWAGNSQIGEGRLTITDSRPNELVRMKLEFIKPFASVATADFTFARGTDETAVTWSMSGSKNFMSKLIGLFMNMDKMIGGQFEEGLATLKTLSEAPAK